MAEWSLDLSKYANGAKAKIREVRRNYAFGLYSSIVKKTPVDTGRARGNWNISVGEPDTTTSERKTAKYTNPEKVPLANNDESIYISNNLPYIATLEYGGFPSPVKKGTKVSKKGEKPARYEIRSEGGFSKQAPEGMVGVTVANSENIFDSAVKKVEGV